MQLIIRFTLLFLITGIGCTAQKKEQVLAIAFYNVENLFDPADHPGAGDDAFTPAGAYRYTEAIYRKKMDNLALAISKMAIDKTEEGPVLIGLAEVENRKVLQDLVNSKTLDKRKLKFLHFDSPDPRGIDVALLYQPKKFKPISARVLPMNISVNGRKERTRDILYVTGKMEQDTLHILVNHWPSRREGENISERKRMLAAAANRRVIDSLLQKDSRTKIIVMGDMNDNPSDKSITQGLKATAIKTGKDTQSLFNPWWHLYKNGEGTSVYKNHWMLFDQILVSAGLLPTEKDKLRYNNAEIFNSRILRNPFGKGKDFPHRSFSGTRWIDGFSDHFPVILYLTR